MIKICLFIIHWKRKLFSNLPVDDLLETTAVDVHSQKMKQKPFSWFKKWEISSFLHFFIIFTKMFVTGPPRLLVPQSYPSLKVHLTLFFQFGCCCWCEMQELDLSFYQRWLNILLLKRGNETFKWYSKCRLLRPGLIQWTNLRVKSGVILLTSPHRPRARLSKLQKFI